VIRTFLVGAAAASIAVLAPAGPARAQSAEQLVARFNQVCIEPGVNREVQAPAMEAAGWMPLPESFLRQFVGDIPLTDVEAFIFSSRDTVLFGMVAAMSMDGETASVCAVSMMPNVSGLRSALVSWSGVQPAPIGTGANDTMIAFRVEGASLAPVELSGAELERLMRRQELVMVAGREYPSMTMVMSMKF
jgi:hypothetical protein